MPDELTFPHRCKHPGCKMPCGTLVIEGEVVRFEWHSPHGHRTHVNSLDVVVLLKLLASQQPGMLRSILERAA